MNRNFIKLFRSLNIEPTQESMNKFKEFLKFHMNLEDKYGDNFQKRELKVAYTYYIEGKSYEKTGYDFNVTRTRINQLINRFIRKLKSRRNELFCFLSEKFKKLSIQKAKKEKEILEIEVEMIAIYNSSILKIFKKSIKEINFSVRTHNCLHYANIKTVGDLVDKSERDLLLLRNFGRCSLEEIEKWLTDRNLSLKQTQTKLGG